MGWFGSGFVMLSFLDYLAVPPSSCFRAIFLHHRPLTIRLRAPPPSVLRFSGYLAGKTPSWRPGADLTRFCHWAWGGSFSDGQGWLAKQGFVDFCRLYGRATSVGGWIALAVFWFLGRGTAVTSWAAMAAFHAGIPNLPMAMLGALLLCSAGSVSTGQYLQL